PSLTDAVATAIYTLPLHDALPICALSTTLLNLRDVEITLEVTHAREALPGAHGRHARQETEEFVKVIDQLVHDIDEFWSGQTALDRKSTRLNSSHVKISYAVFCLK